MLKWEIPQCNKVRSLYRFTVDGFNIEQFNEWIINLAGIDILLIIIFLLVIPVLSLRIVAGYQC